MFVLASLFLRHVFMSLASVTASAQAVSSKAGRKHGWHCDMNNGALRLLVC